MVLWDRKGHLQRGVVSASRSSTNGGARSWADGPGRPGIARPREMRVNTLWFQEQLWGVDAQLNHFNR